MSINFNKNQTNSLGNASLFAVDKIGDQPIPLSQLFAKAALKFAACSCASFSNDEDWIKPFNLRLVRPFANQIFLPGKPRSHDLCFFSEEIGLKVSVFENENEVVVAFGALHSGNTELPEDRAYLMGENQINSIKDNLKGGNPFLYEEARRVVAFLSNYRGFKGKKFTLCGQSFGGSIAQYVGLSLRLETYCFNSVMLGAGLIKAIPERNIQDAHLFLRVISVEDDFASDYMDSSSAYQLMARLFDLPVHWGCKFVFPSAYSSMFERHVFMMGSLMQHLGQSSRARTSELPSYAILPGVLSNDVLFAKMVGITKINFALQELTVCFDDRELRKILAKIKDLSPETYSFLCFSVWLSMGRKDLGDPEWGEKRLVENPQLLHVISNGNGYCFIHDLIKYYEFLTLVFELIPSDDLVLKNPSLAAQQLTETVRNKIGLRHFQVDEKNLSLFISKLHLFFSDQLKNGLGMKMAKMALPIQRREYRLLTQEHLLATRFQVIRAVSKRILIASVEYLGVLKVGGLAEAVREMAVGLKSQGHEVTLVMPKYEKFPQDQTKSVSNSIEKTNVVIDHYFDGKRKDAVFWGRVGNVDTFFIENTKLKNSEPDLFELGTTGIYKIAGDDPHATQLKERFAYFGSALAAFVYQMRDHFDAVIFNDWHGALAIHLAVSRYFDAWLKGSIPALVYVFHNNGYAAQGVLDSHSKHLFDKLALNTNHLNVTEQCLQFADHCCTVSPTYAEEVQGREGNGLAEQMREIANKGNLTGILNGANPKAFNPETDPGLLNWIDPETGAPCPLNYGPNDNIVLKKHEIKLQLQKWLKIHHPHYIEDFGVDVTRENVLLFVGRFDSSQKGLEKFKQAMYAAKETGATLIVMGSYSTADDILAREILEELQTEAVALKGPDWGGALILIDEVNSMGKYNLQQGTVDGVLGVGSLCRAIATFGFFPSKYEPCGLVQFETWLFGSLVIASGVGGFADTVVSDIEDDAFNGFTFKRHDDWNSQEQDVAIRETIVHALNYWDSLNPAAQQEMMAKMIEKARLSGWSSDLSPQGISPIAQYERVLETAVQASKNRLEFEPVELDLSAIS